MPTKAILKKRIQASLKEALGSAPALKFIDILAYDADEAICIAHVKGLIYEIQWELDGNYYNGYTITKSTILSTRRA